MADQNEAGMISGMQPLAVLTGDELLEVSQLGTDGVWRTYSILINKIRTNQGLSAYEIAVKNGFQGTEQQWLESLNGKSAYEIAVELGYTGTEEEWLKTLVGPSAYTMAVEEGFEGTEAEWLESLKGKSIYQLAVANGFEGTEAQYLESIKGKSAYQIAFEIDPTIGSEEDWLKTLIGASAYEVALANGFVGTETAWLQTLKGQSAYQIWVSQGNAGTEADFINSLKGTDGTNGLSAYEIAVLDGYIGDRESWLESLNGTNGVDGLSAYQIWESQPGNSDKTEEEYLESLKGEQGESAYAVAVSEGFVGTQEEWLESLKGSDGQSAYQLWLTQAGNAGKSEADFLESLEGASAYETYKALPGNANKTEAEFIASLKGEDGERGQSAYEVWIDAGNTGTVQQYLTSLKGQDGTNGENGLDGQSINVIANVSEEDFEQIVADNDSRQADAYIVDTFIYIYNGEEWVKSNSIQGPEGRGLNYLGTWPTGVALPPASDEAYRAGDTYVWGATAGNISLWTMVTTPTRAWVDIGVPGPAGKSAYQSWLDAGNRGTEIQFVESLKGTDGTNGKSAYQLWLEQPGNAGQTETQFLNSLKGTDGTNGLSAYQIWVTQSGNEGKSEAEFLASLKGKDGTDGLSAYQVWLSIPGNAGKSEAEFIEAIQGEQGIQGDSAYQVWLALPGNSGKSEAEYIEDITGPQGPKGLPAVAFTIVGQLGNVSQLPAEGNPTEAYYVNSNLYVWVEDESGAGEWQDFGNMNGQSAFQLWQSQPGNESKTEADFLEYMHGESAYAIAVSEGFVGTQEEWVASLKGENGKNLQVEGTKTNAAEIQEIEDPVTQEAWIANDTGHLWIYNGTAWIDAGPFRGTDGTDGKSAYQLWLEQPGNEGKSEAEFLESLKGADGTDGTDGTNGENGLSAYQLWLEQPGNEGKTESEFIASLKGQDGTDGTDGTNGENGLSAYQVWLTIPGNEGKSESDFITSLKGQDGTDGENGTNGRNVEVKGSLADLAAIQALPNPQQQDAYTAIDTNSLYMYIGAAWTFLGKFQGNQGIQGEIGEQGPEGQGINIVGEVETLADRDAFLAYPTGSAVYVLEDHKLYQLNEAGTWNPGISIEGKQGEEGPEGIQGPVGPAVQIMGSYATSAALIAAHPTGNPGEGYLVGPDLYLYGVNPDGGTTEWYNAGPIRGPEGPQGPIGKTGLRGLQGLVGERGSLWINLPAGQDQPTPANGRIGDWAVNESHRIFYKDTSTTWVDMGPLVAGDVNSPLLAEGKVVRLGNEWVPVPVDEVPNPVNGTQYVMKGNASGGTDWAVLSLPAAGVQEVPGGTTVPQGRTSAGWTPVMAVPTGLESTKRYDYLNGQFVLAPVQTSAPTTVDTALCYQVASNGVGSWVTPKFDAYSLKQDTTARSASFQPDFDKQQTFRINSGTAVTVTLGNYTVARTLMAVFVVEGNTNKLNFTAAGGAQIGLNGGTALADIEYGSSQTVITAFWNGFGTWIIAKGPSF